MASKVCGRCNLIKSVNDFNKMAASRDGYQSKCKSCSVELRREWNESNRDRLNERGRNYYANNPQRRISEN